MASGRAWDVAGVSAGRWSVTLVAAATGEAAIVAMKSLRFTRYLRA